MSDCTPLNSCLACGSTDLALKLDLTPQALANNYIPNIGDAEPVFPLAVNMCRHCYHLQLTHAVDPALIYTHYLYVSGTSKTGRDHFKWFADFTKEYAGSDADTVLDIGCNDGTQLDYYKQLGFDTYGIDPAENLYPTSSKNHTIVCNFFNDQTADNFLAQYGKVDIVVAQNSFAHNPAPLEYLLSLKKLMRPSSLFFIQTSQADMVLNNEFDTIYHEHVNFYNINSMNKLCRRAGLNLIDVIKTPIHGTSYIFVVSPTRQQPARLSNLIALEASAGLLTEATYYRWAANAHDLVDQLVDRTTTYNKMHGYRVVGYGAAAKGNTLLQFSGLDIEAIIDDNPLKQGLYSPGANIPIVGIDYLDQFTNKDRILFVPLAWNFYNEIRGRIKQQRNNAGDRFVRYFPKVEVEQ